MSLELEAGEVIEGELVEPTTSIAQIRRDLQVRDRGLGNVELHLVDSFDEAWNFMQWVDGRDEIAIDTETTGLKMGRDTVRLAQVGGRDAGWAIPWDRWSGLLEDVLKTFTRSRGRITMHNAKYDAGMLTHMGVDVPRELIDDTMVMCHILEPNMSAGLKPQAARHVDAAAAGAQVSLDEAINGRGGFTWATVPVDYGPYWQYAALDTVLTARLKEHHWPAMQSYLRSYDLEMASTWVLEKMERHGALIDVDYAILQKQKFDDYVERAYDWIKKAYGVSAGSNLAIIEVLQAAGYEFDKLTASGVLSLDKDVLASIDHPLAETVLRRRQLQRLSSAYLKHFIEDRDENNRIHPDIRSQGARTGRMSISDPSLQNLPTKSETNLSAEAIRNCVWAGPSGAQMLTCDFDQIEMRVLAHYSGDPGLQAAFRSPEDFFVTMARMMYGDPTIDKPHKLRKRVKTVMYAKVYGAGVAKLAMSSGLSEQEVAHTIRVLDATFAGVPRLQKGIEQAAWRRQAEEGEPYAVSCLTGRHQVAEKNKVYALLNRLIQGTAAEAFKMKMCELDAAGLGQFMVVPVHDEIVMEVPDADVPDAVRTLQTIMNDDSMFSVPVSASVSAGQRWGTKEEISE